MSHDSYTCRKFPDTTAFPTRREPGVGNYVGSVVRDTCFAKRLCKADFKILQRKRERERAVIFRSHTKLWKIIISCLRIRTIEHQFGRGARYVRRNWRSLPHQVQTAGAQGLEVLLKRCLPLSIRSTASEE